MLPSLCTIQQCTTWFKRYLLNVLYNSIHLGLNTTFSMHYTTAYILVYTLPSQCTIQQRTSWFKRYFLTKHWVNLRVEAMKRLQKINNDQLLLSFVGCKPLVAGLSNTSQTALTYIYTSPDMMTE